VQKAEWCRLALIGLLAAVSPSCSPERPVALEPASLLLVTADTLRPDALGWIAPDRRTPNLDLLARQGFRFPRAVAPAPLTLPAHASLMSGLVPRRHGVRDNGQVVGQGPSLLAEALKSRGYATAAFISGYPLHEMFGLGRGFDHYDDRLTAGEGAWLERPAPETTSVALAWAARAPEPWFLWVHYYDPHFPYTPPAELVQPGRRGAYDGEVAYMDRAIGDLLRGTESAPKRNLLTVFTADHGESLGEHGEGTHGFFIYDSTVLVPLIFHFPGRIEPGESPAAARLVDLAPTVLDLLGLPPLSGVDGVSLRPLLSRGEQNLPPAYLETRQPWTSYGWAPLRALRHGGWKLIAAPRPELYDLTSDPAEERNLFAVERQKARELERLLDAAEALAGTEAETAADPEVMERLRALGYLGSGRAAGEPPSGLPDPKDRAALRQILTEADELLRRGDWRAALGKFDAVLVEEPDNRFALSRSGEVLLRSGDLPAALTRLRRARELDPDQPEVRSLLAEALMLAGEPAAAASEWMEVVRLVPGRAAAWSNLGAALGRAGEVQKAVAAMERAVEIEPEEPDRLIRLAFAEHGAGEPAAAAGHLEQAARMLGERFPHSGALGLVLMRLGKTNDARSWLARSRPGEAEYAEARVELALLELDVGDAESARRALQEALSASPGLRARVESHPRLGPLVR
jgi:arylsulfatase A-like enzyme/Tfp pilus assembly protein PilF